MKINLLSYMQDRPNIVEWAIIHMMTKRDAHLAPWTDQNGMLKRSSEDMEVCLTIDGVEVDPIEMLQEINRQNDAMITEKAKTLIQERCDGLYEKIRALEDTLDTIVRTEQAKFSE